MVMEDKVPVLSIQSLSLPADHPDIIEASNLLLNAARDWGFIYIKDHGISEKLLQELEDFSKEFFILPLETKKKIKMSIGGNAWRGYFPPGGELTSGIPDSKEGIYFGSELQKDHPKVISGTPLHGQNLWLEKLPGLRPVVLEYINQLTQLGHSLMRAFAIGLNLDENYFKIYFGKDPTILFRIFNYPKSDQVEGWGVGEHTDYGFLTILKTDEHPGLQILSPLSETWIDAPPIRGTFIVNLGDQLEIATRGLLRATPHRVLIERNEARLSWPFFFDPDWDSKLSDVTAEESSVLREWIIKSKNVPGCNRKFRERWDGVDLSARTNKGGQGQAYGDYLLAKVSKCFPELFENVIVN